MRQKTQIEMLKEYYSKPITITYGHGAYPITKTVTLDDMVKGAKFVKQKKKRGPKKGAVKKWSDRLEEIGNQAPPEELMKVINKTEKPTEGEG